MTSQRYRWNAETPRSTGQAVAALIWAVVLLPVGGVMALVTLLGVSPTECYPPAVTYCTQDWLVPVTVGVVFVGWLTAMVLALSAGSGRRGGHLGLSVVVLVVTVVAMVAAIGVWGT